MKSSISSKSNGIPASRRDEIRRGVEFDHSLKIGVLYGLIADPRTPDAPRREYQDEINRYKDEGLALNEAWKEGVMAKKPARDKGPATFSGRGILFTVFDQSRDIFPGPISTIEIIARAIDEALDAGHEDSGSIARYLTTTTFPHIPDRTVRFNSVLKAGDVVGARLTTKMFNAYDDLRYSISRAETKKERELAEAEARGFAEAMALMYSPFSCEDPDDPRQVDWDMIDHLTDLQEHQWEEAKREEKRK